MTTDNDKINEIAKYLEMDRKNKYKKEVVDFYTSIIAKSYEKASAYTNLIIMGGYVLFFTFWSNVRNEVNVSWGRLSVILVIISAIFFIIWEISNMICTSLQLRKLHKAEQISPDKFEEHIKTIEKEERKFQANMAKFWIFELLATIIPGFTGVIILIIIYSVTLFYK